MYSNSQYWTTMNNTMNIHFETDLKHANSTLTGLILNKLLFSKKSLVCYVYLIIVCVQVCYLSHTYIHRAKAN